MRRRVPVLAGAAVLAFVLAGCEGPTGPAGPAGPQGPAGPAGQDANENCTQCHVNDTRLFAREIQYQNSVHYTGGDFERSTTECAPCHTHEGFIERIATGAHTTAADIENPSPPNCRTCHQIHTTYTDADFAFTATAPVDLWFAPGETVDFGEGNLCAQCHQARPVDPLPTIGGDDVTFTTTRYGTHHSPVAEVLGGVGLFDLSGNVAGGPFRHGESDVGCPTCHMAQPFGAQAGGHTMAMTYEYHGAEEDNIAGCQTCHTSWDPDAGDDFGKLGVQADVTAKLDELATLLRAKGIMAAAPSTSSVAGTWPADVAAAFINWQTINEDKSHGIHNPPYVRAILQASINAMQ